MWIAKILSKTTITKQNIDQSESDKKLNVAILINIQIYHFEKLIWILYVASVPSWK